MKLIYLIAGTYNSGGMERVLANKANYLVSHGHEVIIVTTDQRGQQPFFPLDKRIACYDLGINYEENNGKSFFNKVIHYPFKQWRHRKKLSKLLKRLAADVVVSMFCNDASILPQITDGSKKVLEVHFSRFKKLQYGRKGLWKLADKWRNANDIRVVSCFDRFVVLTQEDQTYWGNLPNIQVIPNARTFTFEKPVELTNKVVMAIGRYDYQKGFERLIDAWAKVCSKVDDWTLEIIGDGALRPKMLQQIEEKGLSSRVILKKLPADRMKDAYTNASIFALSSRFEGLPYRLFCLQMRSKGFGGRGRKWFSSGRRGHGWAGKKTYLPDGKWRVKKKNGRSRVQKLRTLCRRCHHEAMAGFISRTIKQRNGQVKLVLKTRNAYHCCISC